MKFILQRDLYTYVLNEEYFLLTHSLGPIIFKFYTTPGYYKLYLEAFSPCFFN